MSLRGHSRSLKLVPFKSLGAVSYSPSIVTLTVSVAFVRYLAPKSGATLKTGLRFVQGHWKWHHLIDSIRVSPSVVTMAIFAAISQIFSVK